MDYKKHYDHLINRAKSRQLDAYSEYHHIVPRCMGGSNDQNNLVALTPEEHYVAHQLLVKMYPKNNALIKAASMMACGRPSNKLYGWLKRKFSKAMSESQIGENNNNYGSFWIHNVSLRISKKVQRDHKIEDGWSRGRVINFDKKHPRSKKEYLEEKKKDTEKLAYELYNDFLKSECNSVTAFAKSINTSQPRLTMLWKLHVPEYAEKRKHGMPFKSE